MKSIQNQYIDLKEGRMNQANFMRNLRMSLPNFITNVTSFDDSIKILKNKGILTEDSALGQFKKDLQQDPDYIKMRDKDGKALPHDEYIDPKFGMKQPKSAYHRQFGTPNVTTNDPFINNEPEGELDEDITGIQTAGNPSAEAGMRKAFRSPAFEAGKKAAFDGVEMEANPYDPDSKEGQEWIEGWIQGGEKMVPDENPFDDVIDTDGDINEEEKGYVFQQGEEVRTPEGNGVVIDSDGFNYVIDLNDGGTVRYNEEQLQQVNRPSKLSEIKKAKLSPNQVNPHELYLGTKIELEHTDDIDEAQTIALQHLAENPFYYTALHLSGVESNNAAPKVKKPEKKKDETTMVDKANQMKTPKGVEKIKASANKAKKETNKVVKGVKELTHNAKSVRGVKKMASTGGKMKKVKVNEGFFAVDHSRNIAKSELEILKKDPVIRDWYNRKVLEIVKDLNGSGGFVVTWDNSNPRLAAEIKDYIINILHMDLGFDDDELDPAGGRGLDSHIEEKQTIKESILKIYNYDPSSHKLIDVDVEYFASEEEAKKAALAHHWQVAYDNDHTDLSKEEFISQTNFEDLEPYENYDYYIVPDKIQERQTIKESIKKLIREILNESMDLESAKKQAYETSKAEGVVQHVNELPNGSYIVSDWYDSDTTVCSYENGEKLN